MDKLTFLGFGQHILLHLEFVQLILLFLVYLAFQHRKQSQFQKLSPQHANRPFGRSVSEIKRSSSCLQRSCNVPAIFKIKRYFFNVCILFLVSSEKKENFKGSQNEIITLVTGEVVHINNIYIWSKRWPLRYTAKIKNIGPKIVHNLENLLQYYDSWWIIPKVYLVYIYV